MPYLLPNKCFLPGVFLVLLQQTLVYAQEPLFVELKTEAEITLTSGVEERVLLSFLITEGFHIQADQVKDKNLVPSVLSFEKSDGLVIGNPVFPKAVEFRMKGVEEALDVYSGVLEVTVPVKPENSQKKGTLLIHGNLHYQACDDFKCYFPRDLPFLLKVHIE